MDDKSDNVDKEYTEIPPLLVIRAVCEFCHDTSINPTGIEINYFTKQLIFDCPLCNKTNRVSLALGAKPLPRTRLAR